MIIKFPPIESATEEGLLAFGGDLEPESIILAYSQGIFPWPLPTGELVWFAPPQRTVLFLDDFTVNKSLQKVINKNIFEIKFNSAFSEVIKKCAEVVNRGNQNGTWITEEIQVAYCKLHELGIAHSVEAYFESRLVGGLYGVAFGKLFCGESMFYRMNSASLVAFYFLIQHLKKQNCKLIDCQTSSKFFKKLGSKIISRDHFNQLIKEEIVKDKINFVDSIPMALS